MSGQAQEIGDGGMTFEQRQKIVWSIERLVEERNGYKRLLPGETHQPHIYALFESLDGEIKGLIERLWESVEIDPRLRQILLFHAAPPNLRPPDDIMEASSHWILENYPEILKGYVISSNNVTDYLFHYAVGEENTYVYRERFTVLEHKIIWWGCVDLRTYLLEKGILDAR